MTTPASERAARWRRYLADLEAHAAVPRPLVSEGMLVRVTGLVLEAAGVRAPVGSVCEVSSSSGAPVSAEVVGFHRDRAYLMPTGGPGNGFRFGFGNNLFFDGANWRTRGDGANNAGSALLTDIGLGHMQIFTLPPTGGTRTSTWATRRRFGCSNSAACSL